MGAKEKTLRRILTENNLIDGFETEPNIAEQVLFGEIKDEVFEVFKALGGIERAYAYRGKCDIVTSNFILELDEQLHFNDYRLITLSSPIYKKLKNFPLEEYKQFCMIFKDNCLRSGSFGQKWTSDSCEKMFGEAGPKGELSGKGSPRWKQRAFYDFVKDVSQLVTGIPVVRISIYDKIDFRGRKTIIENVLEDYSMAKEEVAEGIKKLIYKRVGIH